MKFPKALLAITLGSAVLWSTTGIAGASVGQPAPPIAGEDVLITGFTVNATTPAEPWAWRYTMEVPAYEVDGEWVWSYCVDSNNRFNAGTGNIEASTSQTAAIKGELSRLFSQLRLPAPDAIQTKPALIDGVASTKYKVPMRSQDRIESIAAQLAVWSLSDSMDNFALPQFDETTDGVNPLDQAQWADAPITWAQVEHRMNELLTDAKAHPVATPHPAVTVNPGSASGVIGDTVTLSVTGTDVDSIALSASNGATIHPTNSTGGCDTSTTINSLPGTGGTFCVRLTSAGGVVVTVDGSSTYYPGWVADWSGEQERVLTSVLHPSAHAGAELTATIAGTTTTTTAPPVTSPPVTAVDPASVVAPVVQGESTDRGQTISTDELAATGQNTGPLALVGLSSIVAGLGACVLARRSRRALAPATIAN